MGEEKIRERKKPEHRSSSAEPLTEETGTPLTMLILLAMLK